jgi:radical SAM superfamily enzyme YgiQ (UPF0313 family)
MKKILLVSPYVASDVRAFWVTGGDGKAMDVPGVMVPLGLATIAALTPESYHLDIWDECIRGLIDDDTVFKHDYDLVGITGYLAHLPRVKQVAEVFRKKDVPVAVGGPGISAAPHMLTEEDCNVIFVGEAERTWPQFIRDWESGAYSHAYRQIEKIDISASQPAPQMGQHRGGLPPLRQWMRPDHQGMPLRLRVLRRHIHIRTQAAPQAY